MSISKSSATPTNPNNPSSKQALPANTYDNSQTELDLLDVIQFIRHNSRYLLLGMLFGVVLAAIIAFLLPKQYEVKALVKVGQLGSVSTVGLPIEPGLQVIDRIKSQSFQDDVLKELKISVDDDDSKLVKQFRNNLQVKLEKSELLTISLKALSKADALTGMQEVVNQLNAVHKKMSYPTIARLKLELDSVNNELLKADNEAKQLTKILQMQSDKLTDLKFSQTVLLNSIRISKEQDYRNFRDTKRMLEEKLSPERTFATQVLGRIQVSKKPVFPNYNLFIAAGLLLGLMASFIYILIMGVRLRLASHQAFK